MSDVVAVAEARRGELRAVSLELLTAGRQLADETGGRLHTAVVGGAVDRFGDQLARRGVDVVQTVAAGRPTSHDVLVQAVTALIDEHEPAYVLAPNSAAGLDYAPAVAERQSMPLVTDATGLAVGASGLVATRAFYGGKAEGTVRVDGGRAVVTVRPGAWPAAEHGGDATVESFDPTIDETAVRSTVTGFEEAGSGAVDITDADTLVSVGRGIGDEDSLDLIFDLADAMDATVSASRPIIDNGWLPADHQVGQSGKVVTPEVYVAIGISGAVQHVAGMKGAETIVAINDDPSAPIFDIADYGIVDDLFEVVPALTDEFAG